MITSNFTKNKEKDGRNLSMTRCAFLPSRGDPITLKLVLYFFDKVWGDEVDKLYININSQIDESIVNYIRKFATSNPKVIVSHSSNSLQHGGSITKMFHESTEDNIVLIEDDSFVYGKGMIDKYFRMIETGKVDAAGSLRNCCSPGIAKKGEFTFNLLGREYEGGNIWFWPCFFFVKRKDLLKTDLDFCSKGWEPGEYIAPIDFIPEVIERSDTMVWMSMQLRALGLKFAEFPNPGDVGNPNYQWTHTNSLSSFIESMITDDDDHPLAFRTVARPPVIIETTLIGEKSEYERKLARMTMALRKFWNEFEEIKEFRDLYKKGMEKYAARFDFDWVRIEKLIVEYSKAIGI